jgi:hypothetical protein
MIHYHGLPMSGAASDMVKAFAGRHAMVSFETPEPLALAACAARWCGSNGVQHNMELVG